MNHLRLLFLACAFATTSAFAQSARGPMSTRVTGHMAVTLLSPAALTNPDDLRFNNVSLRSAGEYATAGITAQASTTSGDMKMASVKVAGNSNTYSVTVSGSTYGINASGNQISIGRFTATSNTDYSGSGTIYIGATMHVKKKMMAEKQTQVTNTPLAVTVNYN